MHLGITEPMIPGPFEMIKTKDLSLMLAIPKPMAHALLIQVLIVAPPLQLESAKSFLDILTQPTTFEND